MASETQTPSAAQTAEMVEVLPAGAKGNGLFARVDIPKGTRILAEAPLIAIPVGAPQQFTKFAEIARSMPDAMAELDQLHCNPDLLDEQKPGNVLSQARGEGFDPAADPDTVRRYGVYRTNCVDMPRAGGADGRGGAPESSGGLCPLYARINHSCVPNAYFSWNERRRREVVHAARDVAAGEEILANYLGSDATFMTRAQRGARLRRHWGFACGCAACAGDGDADDADDDELRGELAWLEARLVEADASRAGPEAAEEGLEAAEELLGLLQDAGLGGYPLCAVYRDCSQFSLALGDEQEAIRFAKLNLETQRLVLGSDAVDSEWIRAAGLRMPEG